MGTYLLLWTVRTATGTLSRDHYMAYVYGNLKDQVNQLQAIQARYAVLLEHADVTSVSITMVLKSTDYRGTR